MAGCRRRRLLGALVCALGAVSAYGAEPSRKGAENLLGREVKVDYVHDDCFGIWDHDGDGSGDAMTYRFETGNGRITALQVRWCAGDLLGNCIVDGHADFDENDIRPGPPSEGGSRGWSNSGVEARDLDGAGRTCASVGNWMFQELCGLGGTGNMGCDQRLPGIRPRESGGRFTGYDDFFAGWGEPARGKSGRRLGFERYIRDALPAEPPRAYRHGPSDSSTGIYEIVALFVGGATVVLVLALAAGAAYVVVRLIRNGGWAARLTEEDLRRQEEGRRGRNAVLAASWELDDMAALRHQEEVVWGDDVEVDVLEPVPGEGWSVRRRVQRGWDDGGVGGRGSERGGEGGRWARG